MYANNEEPCLLVNVFVDECLWLEEVCSVILCVQTWFHN